MNVALVLSGGTGERLGGDIPKQYIEVGGKPVIAHCLETFGSHGAIEKIQVVAEGRWHGCIRRWAGDKLEGFSAPGLNRQLSIYNGLEDIRKYASPPDKVIIHDGARPFVTKELVSDLVGACEGYDGAMPALPVKDTLYLSDGHRVTSLLDRSILCAGQSPEIYRLGKYYEANKRLLPDRILEINGSTEAAFLAGMKVAVIEGDENNFKITTERDLKEFIRRVDCRG